MPVNLRQQALALACRFGVEQGQRVEQVHRRRPRVEFAQALDRGRAATGGDRARGVVAGNEVERGRVRDHQYAPQREHLGVIAAPGRALTREHQRPGRLRRGLASVHQRRIGLVALVPGIGLERDLAPVVRNARGERAGAAVLELLRDGGGGAPVARALVQREQGQPRFGVESRAFERVVGAFGAVEQARLHEVLRERILGAVAFAGGQVGAVQQVLMDPHRALELAAAAKQVAKREVQVGRVGIMLDGLDEGIDRLVVLVVQQQVQALVVGLR